MRVTTHVGTNTAVSRASAVQYAKRNYTRDCKMLTLHPAPARVISTIKKRERGREGGREREKEGEGEGEEDGRERERGRERKRARSG